MNADRFASRWTRIAIAMAFGFMNLGHGPIMTFAHAGNHDVAPVDAPAHHHASHHQHHATNDDLAPVATSAPDQPTTCNAYGCFITVGAVIVDDRPPALLPIGKLLPPPNLAGAADAPKPADPPPRLHV